MNKKILVFTNLITLLVLGALLIKERYPQKIWHHFNPPTQVKEHKIGYWLNRQELFEALPHDSNSIVFLGTSLTENFELNEIFKRCDLKNRGITADLTAGILNRLGTVIADHPSKIFLEVGVNDLGKGVPMDTLLGNYNKILDHLLKACPNTQIYIQSLLPVANKGQYPTYNNTKVNSEIIKVNEALKVMSQKKKLVFIDLYSSFEKNGEINPDYVIQDGIHLNGSAYNLWASLLKTYLP